MHHAGAALLIRRQYVNSIRVCVYEHKNRDATTGLSAHVTARKEQRTFREGWLTVCTLTGVSQRPDNLYPT